VQVTAAQSRLDAAQASASTAEAARLRYSDDYATVARLGKAVPVDDDMPSLVYQLQTTAKANHVDFRSIKLNATGSPAPAPTAPAAAVASANGKTPAPAAASAASAASASTVSSALPPGATVGAAGFPTMPFSFNFNGSFFHMQRFLKAVNGLTDVNGKSIKVSGRLLTVDGVALKASAKGFPNVDATVAVTAYLLPADEGLTPGAAAPSAGTGSSAGTTATASLIGTK
jgi:Tfp pilus assembly protein PilO